MTLDDFVRRVREARGDARGDAAASFLVFTTGPKEFFAGEVLDLSADALLVRQADGTEVLVLRSQIVAISAAEP